jgi:hypothetical protein
MQQAQGPEPDYSEQLQEAYEQNPLETMAWVAQQAAEAATKKYEQQMLPAQVDVVAQQAKNMIAAKYPDFAQLETQVAQILQDDPGLVDPKAGYSLDATARTYERAYQLAAAQQWRAAQDQAATMAAQGRSDKLGVQTVSGAGGRPDVAGPESDDDYFERLRAAGRPTYGSLASRATQT